MKTKILIAVLLASLAWPAESGAQISWTLSDSAIAVELEKILLELRGGPVLPQRRMEVTANADTSADSLLQEEQTGQAGKPGWGLARTLGLITYMCLVSILFTLYFYLRSRK